MKTTSHFPTLTSNQTILTLDLGTKTGWALRMQDGTITSGTRNFQTDRFSGGGMRYLKFKHWLDTLEHQAHGIGSVYFEEVRRHLGVDAAHVYGGFLAHLTAWCEYKLIPYQAIPVGTIKKNLTGKGNASKQEMIAAIRALGFKPTDDNETDALAILHLILNQQMEVTHER